MFKPPTSETQNALARNTRQLFLNISVSQNTPLNTTYTHHNYWMRYLHIYSCFRNTFQYNVG